MPSLGKTNTPEFGSPCYTEPDVAPARRDPVGPHPDGRRVLRRRRRRGRRRAGAGGARARTAAARSGSRPRAAGWSGSSPRAAGSAAPRVRRPGRSGHRRPLARTVRDAAALLDVLAGRRVGDPSWAPPPSASFLDACDREPGRLRVARFIAPVIADSRRRPEQRRGLGGRVPRCWSRWATRSRTSRCRCRREAVADFETCWAVLTAMSPAPPGTRAPAPPADPLALPTGATPSAARSSAWPSAAMRQHAADALAALAAYDVGAHADPRRPAAARRRAARRRRPGPRLRRPRRPSRPGPAPGTSPACRPSRCRCTGPPTGLPVGVMLAARPAEEEAAALGLARQVEAAAPWVDQATAGLVRWRHG